MLPYWQLVLTALTLIVSSVSVVLMWRSNLGATDQREVQARREEWWRRFTWAIGLLSEDEEFRQEVGVGVVKRLAFSPLIGTDERSVLEEVFDAVNRRSASIRATLEREIPYGTQGERDGV